MSVETTSPADALIEALIYRFVSDDIRIGDYPDFGSIFTVAAQQYREKYPFPAGVVPYRILVVCNENQGRSQIEETFLRLYAEAFGLDVSTRSAGVNATPHKNDGHPNPDVIAEMRKWGLDISDATVDQLKVEDVTEDTILIVLSDPAELPPYAYRAFTVISNYYDDPFPGEERPADLSSRVESLTESISYMSFYMMIYLYESLRLSDITIFY